VPSEPAFHIGQRAGDRKSEHATTFYATAVQNNFTTLDIGLSLNYVAFNTAKDAAITDLGVGAYASIRFTGIVESKDGARLALAEPAHALHGSFRVDRSGTFVSFDGVDIDWANASADSIWPKAFAGRLPRVLRKTLYKDTAAR
jgi:hypothetical protein